MRNIKWFAEMAIAGTMAVTIPVTSPAELTDELLDLSSLILPSIAIPDLILIPAECSSLPTFETPPQGQASIGTTELLSVHGAFSPLNGVQIGGTIVPWIAGFASVGAKVRLWRSTDSRFGTAVGVNYMSFNLEMGNDDLGAVATGYLASGYRDDRGQIHAGVFVLESRSEDHWEFCPYPDPDHSCSRIEKDRAVFGALGLSIAVRENTHAMLELWGIGLDDAWPIALPGFRFFQDNTSVGVMLTPIWYDEGKFHLDFLPIFDITYHLR